MSFLNRDLFLSLSTLTIVIWLGHRIVLEPTIGLLESLIGWSVFTVVTIGGHEAAHYIWAENFCNRDPWFEDIDDRPWGIIAVMSLVLLLSVPYGWGTDQRVWISLGGIIGLSALLQNKLKISAGAVRIDDKMEVFCDTTTSLAGPVYNLGLGVFLFVFGWDSIWVEYTVTLNLWFALYNSLPVGVLDGGHAWKGGIGSKLATLTVSGSSMLLLLNIIT